MQTRYKLAIAIKEAMQKQRDFLYNGYSISIIEVSDITIDIGQLYDINGNTISDGIPETIKSGRFEGELTLKRQDQDDKEGYVSQSFRLSELNSFSVESYSFEEGFKVSIINPTAIYSL